MYSVDVCVYMHVHKYMYNANCGLVAVVFALLSVARVVDVMKKGCRHVQVQTVPEPVINHLLSKMEDDSGEDGAVGVDWSRIDSKLVSTLLPFQKEGVE